MTPARYSATSHASTPTLQLDQGDSKSSDLAPYSDDLCLRMHTALHLNCTDSQSRLNYSRNRSLSPDHFNFSTYYNVRQLRSTPSNSCMNAMKTCQSERRTKMAKQVEVSLSAFPTDLTRLISLYVSDERPNWLHCMRSSLVDIDKCSDSPSYHRLYNPPDNRADDVVEINLLLSSLKQAHSDQSRSRFAKDLVEAVSWVFSHHTPGEQQALFLEEFCRVFPDKIKMLLSEMMKQQRTLSYIPAGMSIDQLFPPSAEFGIPFDAGRRIVQLLGKNVDIGVSSSEALYSLSCQQELTCQLRVLRIPVEVLNYVMDTTTIEQRELIPGILVRVPDTIQIKVPHEDLLNCDVLEALVGSMQLGSVEILLCGSLSAEKKSKISTLMATYPVTIKIVPLPALNPPPAPQSDTHLRV